MIRNVLRMMVLGLLLTTPITIGAQETELSCAPVGEGCEGTCADFCSPDEVLYDGCGCPSIGTYGNSCDCWCDGNPYVTTGIAVKANVDPQCHFWTGTECDYCPE